MKIDLLFLSMQSVLYYNCKSAATHFFPSKEYLLTGISTKSPHSFATPDPGRASSIKSFGVNTSAPSLNANSGLLDMTLSGNEVRSGNCEERPRRENGRNGRRESGNIMGLK